MAAFMTTLSSPLGAEDAFRYMADVRNFAEWDPGTKAVRVAGGRPGAAQAAYDLDFEVAGRVTTLHYEVISFDPGRSFTMRATGGLVTAVDHVTVEPTSTGVGSTVAYEATLTLRSVLRVADPLLNLMFQRICERAAAGLAGALHALPDPAAT